MHKSVQWTSVHHLVLFFRREQAYAYALTKTSDEEGVRAFHSLIGSVLDELGLHATYAATWGIDVHNVSLNTANQYHLPVYGDVSSRRTGIVAPMITTGSYDPSCIPRACEDISQFESIWER